MSNLPVAIVLALAGSVLNALGFTLQKRGQVSIDPSTNGWARLVRSLKTPAWLVGFVLNVSTFPMTIYAISLGVLSVIMPLYSLSLVMLVMLGRWYLHEGLSRAELAGIAAIITGCTVLSLAAADAPHPVDPQPLAVALYIGAMFTVPVVGFAITRDGALGFALLAGAAISTTAILAKVLSIVASGPPHGGIDLLSPAFIMALVLGLFSGTGDAILSALFYTIVLAILGHQASLIFAFSKGKAVFVVPVEKVVSTSLPTLAGFVLFGDTLLPLVFAGIACSLLGSVMLARSNIRLPGAG